MDPHGKENMPQPWQKTIGHFHISHNAPYFPPQNFA